MKYVQSRVIFALFTKKCSIKQLVNNHSNVLIRAVNKIDMGVTGIKVLEHQKKLKIHKILLARYLRKEKIEVFCQEIESFTEMQLKTVFCQLIGKSQLEKRQESGNKRRFAIVLTMYTSKKVVKLYFKELRLRRLLKVGQKYWEVRPGLV